MAQTETLSLVEPRESPKMGRIFDALMEGYPGAVRGYQQADRYCCWGIIGNNHPIMFHNPHIFCDMPYNGRLDPEVLDYDNSYWRWCHDGLHDNRKLDVPSDRFEEWGLPLEDYTNDGDHILVVPSSNTMTGILHGMGAQQWAHMVTEGLKMRTNRPIKVRFKPRKNGTSGPSVADVPLEDDLENCYAVVASASLVAVEALRKGIPVIRTTPECPTAWCSNEFDIDINNLMRPERDQLFHNLAYKQYSIKEMREGVCYENTMKFLT